MATASEPEPRTVPKVCDLHSTPVAVLLIAAAAILVEMAVSTWYGNHRDELYFLRCGDHLAWRFVNQPPSPPPSPGWPRWLRVGRSRWFGCSRP